MNCDYGALESEKNNLIKEFNLIKTDMSQFISSSQTICKSDVWTSDVEDEFSKLLNGVVDNFGIVTDQFNNVNLYINTVVENYRTVENRLLSIK